MNYMEDMMDDLDDTICISRNCIFDPRTDDNYVNNFCSAMAEKVLTYHTNDYHHVLALVRSFDFTSFSQIENFKSYITMGSDTLMIEFCHNGRPYKVEFYPHNAGAVVMFE